MKELDFRNFNQTDSCIMKLDNYRHLVYYNLRTNARTNFRNSCAMKLNYVDVFKRYYKRLKKIKNKNLGFEINYNSVNELISILEEHHKKKIEENEGAGRRILANRNIKKVREKIMKRYNYKCNYCQTDKRLTIDHIIPITKGGSDYKSNLQVLCLSCNIKKSNKI
jgi:hypothetical protein